MTMKVEIVLNRAWIYGNGIYEEPTGEKNFVLDAGYLKEIFESLFLSETDFDDFLDTYVPEEDGEKIYQRAKKDGKIIEEFESKILEETHEKKKSSEITGV